LDKFSAKKTPIEDRPLSSKSSKSALTAADWGRIERKLKEVVVNIFDTRVKELSNTIQSLATTNILLELRIQGY